MPSPNKSNEPRRRATGRMASLVLAAFCLLAPGVEEEPKAEAPPPGAAATSTGVTARVEAAFGSDCETLLLREIEAARREVLVAIYTLTRRNITRALAAAVERKVKVHVKYDAKTAAEMTGMETAIGYLRNRKVKCTAIEHKDENAKMHHKFAVIDRAKVLTGSYNFTTAATVENDENLALIESETMAEAYAREFERLKSR